MTLRSNLILLASLFLLFGITLILNSAWIFNPIGGIEEWGYFGALLHPAQMRHAFPDHPIGDLLPLILPAGTFYHFFPPFIANLLFKGLLFIFCNFLMFQILFGKYGGRAAVLGTMAFALSKETLFSLGSDYPQGMVILYQMLSILLLLRAVGSRNNWKLFLAGFFVAFSVSTALLSIVYAVPLTLLFALENILRKVPMNLAFWAKTAACVILGFICGIVVLGCAHFAYTGDFVYFSNTLHKASTFLSQSPHAKIFSMHHSWILLPLYLIILSAPSILLFRGSWGRLSAKYFMVCNYEMMAIVVAAYASIASVEVLKNTGTISDPFYFNQTLPYTYLAATGLFFSNAEMISLRKFKLLAFTFLGISLIDFWYSTTGTRIYPNLYSFGILQVLAIFASLLMTASRPVLRAGLILLFFLTINFSSAFTTERIRLHANASPLIPTRSIAQQITVDWVELMNKVDPERIAILWYDSSGTHRQWSSLAAASHYWQGRVFNESLPEIEVKMGEVGVMDVTQLIGKTLIIMAENSMQVEVGLEHLKSGGVAVSCADSMEFISAKVRYFSVFICKVDSSAK